jgi:hypothetical protein
MAKNIHVGLATSDEQKLDSITRKVILDPANLAKMKKLVSLFYDELGDDPKEIEVISFFFAKSFEVFLKSGEIQERFNKIVGD